MYNKTIIEYLRGLFLAGVYVGVITVIAFVVALLFSTVAETKEKSTEEKVYEVLQKIDAIENDDNVYYDKITTIEPKDAGDQYCYVKVVIKQKGENIVKEEILECADGRKTVDGPSYWQMFAQFYYRDVSTPEYCRFYSRPEHIFKSFGKVCLNKDGDWRVQK